MSFPPVSYRHPRLCTLAALLLLCLCASGCPKPGPQGGTPARLPDTPSGPKETDEEKVHKAGMALSLFRETPLANNAPDALAFSRDGARVFAHGFNAVENTFYMFPFALAEGRLNPGTFSIMHPQFNVPQIAAEPHGNEVLLTSQWQPGGKLVRDLLWRISDQFPPEMQNQSGLPYDRSAGMPADGPFDTWMELKPFYSWGGETVIVPLRHLGLCLVDLASGSGEYLEYPKLPFEMSDMQLGPLPDEGTSRRIYASFWVDGIESDQCRVFVLDLGERKWEEIFSLSWIAYKVGVSNVFDEPWLVAGSRPAGEKLGDSASYAPADGTQGKRVPRLALVVPRAGTEQILELWGNPVWDIAVEPYGKYVSYMDRQREGIVRLNPASGELDLDSRWFSDDPKAKLFIGSGGEHTFYWKRNILIEANWDKHEQKKGYK